MSGHSKWATIKRQKAANDNARGQVFSRLSRAITVAVKTGGGPNPENNFKLKMAIEAARVENMPRDTIDRAVNKASAVGEIWEVTYEGFGPEGVNIIVNAATDNRNRTAQEVKSNFEHCGGRMAGPGSVAFNFDTKGFVLVGKNEDIDSQILELIDLGAEEVEEASDGLEVYCAIDALTGLLEALDVKGFKVLKHEVVQKPKSVVTISDPKVADRLYELLDSLESLEDVSRVFDNADIQVSI